MSKIKDVALAPSGELKIDWVKRNCPLLRTLESEFTAEKPFAGLRIALSVHLEAKKLDLKGVPKSELPAWSYLAKNCYLILPLVLLVWLVASGTRTMAVSAAISIFGAFLIGFVNFLMNNWRERAEGEGFLAVLAQTGKIALFTTVDAFAAGTKNVIPVAVACAMAGMIAGCITVTGLASTIINVIVLMAGDFVIVGLVLPTILECWMLWLAKHEFETSRTGQMISALSDAGVLVGGFMLRLLIVSAAVPITIVQPWML